MCSGFERRTWLSAGITSERLASDTLGGLGSRWRQIGRRHVGALRNTDGVDTSRAISNDPSRGKPDWVNTMGGPLIAVPATALNAWRGCTMEGVIAGDGTAPDDYDRVCEVNTLAEAIPVGENGAQALVLGDEPARSCFLPDHRGFLRWLAAYSEAELMTAAEKVLTDPATPWEECGSWVTDGPAVLMDSAESGAELDVRYSDGRLPEQAPVPLSAGRWRIRAVHTQPDDGIWVGLVQLLPVEAEGESKP